MKLREHPVRRNQHTLWRIVLIATIINFSYYCMYVCMYSNTYSKIMDQPGKVANPARGQLNRENECFPIRVRA